MESSDEPSFKPLFDAYLADNSNTCVWDLVFEVLNRLLPHPQKISSEAQNYINYYLEKAKDSQHTLYPYFQNNKQIICYLYDLLVPSKEQTVCDVLDPGIAYETVLSKQDSSSEILSEQFNQSVPLSESIEAVGTYFCLLMQKYKERQGALPLKPNRQIFVTLKSKKDWFFNQIDMVNSITKNSICLMEGYLDNLKPMVSNKINIESLLQTSSPNFNEKIGMLTGHPGGQELAIKKVKLVDLFDLTHAGRESTEAKINCISLDKRTDLTAQKNNECWNLTTCISEHQDNLHGVFEKLPRIIRSKSHGDMLSFLRIELFPAFRYHIMRPGYTEGPILSETMKIIFNAGRVPFEMISIPRSEQSKLKGSARAIWRQIDTMDIKYSKIQVRSRNLALVPTNNYYIIHFNPEHCGSSNIVEIIQWEVLPKIKSQVQNFVGIVQQKFRRDSRYFVVPYKLMLLDYLSHEYLIQDNKEFLDYIRDCVQKALQKEQKCFLKLLGTRQTKAHVLTSEEKFCSACRREILNYFTLTSQKMVECMNCSKNESDIYLIYHPQTIRTPLTLVHTMQTKNAVMSIDLCQKYEQNICSELFMGSVQGQACKGNQINSGTVIGRHFMEQISSEQLFFKNRAIDLKIEECEQTIMKIAFTEPKSETEVEKLLQRIPQLTMLVADVQKLRKEICSRYDRKNLVGQVMLILGFPKMIYS